MSMADRDGKIWMDGKLVDWRDANIHVLTHTLHYGMGVFEGVRAYKTSQGTAIFRLKEHTKRLFNSAKIFQMEVPFDQATIEAAQLEVVRENKLESCYIRPIIWVGSESSACRPRATPFTWPLLRGRGARIWAKTASRRVFASRLRRSRAITSTCRWCAPRPPAGT